MEIAEDEIQLIGGIQDIWLVGAEIERVKCDKCQLPWTNHKGHHAHHQPKLSFEYLAARREGSLVKEHERKDAIMPPRDAAEATWELVVDGLPEANGEYAAYDNAPPEDGLFGCKGRMIYRHKTKEMHIYFWKSSWLIGRTVGGKSYLAERECGASKLANTRPPKDGWKADGNRKVTISMKEEVAAHKKFHVDSKSNRTKRMKKKKGGKSDNMSKQAPKIKKVIQKDHAETQKASTAQSTSSEYHRSIAHRAMMSRLAGGKKILRAKCRKCTGDAVARPIAATSDRAWFTCRKCSHHWRKWL